ncbi:MAG: Xaa-Pro peptidase family protein [Planctomycetota bacterium]
MSKVPPITVAEYAKRRDRVLRALKGACAVVFAGDGSHPLRGRWRPHPHFKYLTGIEAEPGAAVVFDPTNPIAKRRIVLVLQPADAERDQWDGLRERLGTPLRTRLGFDTVIRSWGMPGLLTDAARRAGRFACLHAPSVYPQPVAKDLAIARQIAERVPGVSIEDRTQLLPELRAIKSPAELRLIKAAIRATHTGLNDSAAMLKPGVTEAEIAATLMASFSANGATDIGYNLIVGAGVNSTVLHYNFGDATVEDGDVVLFDVGAEVHGYTADVTRVLAANGRFDAEQARIYDLVVRAEQAAIKATKPGGRLSDAHEAALSVFENTGLQDSYIHGIGHGLGSEVHEPRVDHPLRKGMVVTIEPGLYDIEKKIGVRIEDDILLTDTGTTNLTVSIPKKLADVEAWQKSARR